VLGNVFALFPSELGWMGIVGRDNRLLHVRFGETSAAAVLSAVRPLLADDAVEDDWHPALAERLQAFAAGAPDDFRDIEVDFEGWTPFARRVLEKCRRLDWGKTSTYAALAARAGSPDAARAVGNVMARNRCPLVIPCHRVLGSGSLGGYSAPGGLAVKRRLLEMERAAVEVVSAG
jgi:methylated-DNA-[protein]-cysteine S-methyltransferase